MSRFQQMQNELGQWADATFGDRTPQSLLRHLEHEIEEVCENPKDELEWADCLTLLVDAYRLATGHNTEHLLDACFEKIAINKQRKWSPPNEDGVCFHIREDKQ